MKGYTHLQRGELCIIEKGLASALSLRAIARKLKRAPSTVSRELAQWHRTASDGAHGTEQASLAVMRPFDAAVALAQRRSQREHCARNAARYAPSAPMFDALLARLREQHSLEQACCGLRHSIEAFGPAPRLPSRATLYRHAKALGWRNRSEYPSLRLRHYRSQKARAEDRARAPNHWVDACPTVAQRPVEIVERRALMAAEIDSIGSPKGDTARLVVATCRRTRYTLLGLLRNTGAKAVVDWITRRVREQHLPLFALIPDQGVEFSRLPSMKGVTIYPCQPHRPWQKPTVENTNGLIRFYIPKGKFIGNLTPEFVAYVEHQLNHRPRKCLHWKTPAQLLSELHPAVAL
jgi:IS30 family transposase